MADPSVTRLYGSALGYLPRLLERSRSRPAVTILMYHGIVQDRPPVADWCLLPQARFAWQMEYVRTHFDVLPLTGAMARLRSGGVTRPTAVITFDDGFQNLHDVAYPVLQRLGLPATAFLTTGFVGTGDTIWFCRLLTALTRTDRSAVSWRGRRYDLRGAEARRAASAELQERLKQLPHDELLSEVAALAEELGGAADVPASLRILDRASIMRMAASGLVEFGAHTRTHAILTRAGADRARAEIEDSVRQTAALTGRPCETFAYPNGTAHDYDRSTTTMLHDLGITAAVTTVPGLNTTATAPLELHRDGVGGGHGALRFPATVHHTRQYLTTGR